MIESPLPTREIITVSPLYRWLTIGFALVSLIMAGFIISSILGKSTIIITPKLTQTDLPFVLAIYKNAEQINAEQAGIVAEVVETNLEKEITISLPQTQSTSTKASGIVTIVNKSKKEQTLIAGTQLMAENAKIYRLEKTIVSLPGKDIKVRAIADQEGEDYDSEQSKLIIVKLRTDLQALIYGETDKLNRKQSGQTEVNEQTVAAGLEQAKKQLSDELTQQLKSSGVNESTISINYYRQSYDVKTVTASGELTFTVGAIAKAAKFSNQDLASVIAQNLPKDQKNQLTIVDPSNTSFQIEYSSSTKDQLGVIKGITKLNVANIKINKSELAGKTVEEVKNILSAAGAESVNIILPFWQNKLPRLSNNIDVQIKK